MLSEDRRKQLDSIVDQMSGNREKDADIQFVVDDFKSKYENEQPETQHGASGTWGQPTTDQGPGGIDGVARAVLPRSFQASDEGAGIGRTALAGAGDALSGLLRIPAAAGRVADTHLGTTGDHPQGFTESLNQVNKGQGPMGEQNFLSESVNDPSIVPGIATGAAALNGARALGLTGFKALSAAGAAGGAGNAAIHQADNYAQGKGVSPLAAAVEVAAGAAIPYAFKGIGMAAHFQNKVLGRLAQGFSGSSEEALRKFGFGFGQGAKDLSEAAGKQDEIGGRLVKMLNNLDEHIPEAKDIDKILPNIPDVSIENSVNSLRAAKKGGTFSESKAVNEKIDNKIAELQAAADPDGYIPAARFRNIRKEVDQLVGDSFGKESGDYVGALKGVRHQMAEDLVASADASGVPEYADKMRSLAQKYKAADKLEQFLGKSAQTREARQESFVANLFGKNKKDRVRAVQGIQDLFGGDFLNDAKNAHLAAQLGEDGRASLLPTQSTGRALLGVAAAPLTAGGSLALTSPRLAAGALATSGAIDRFLNRGVSSLEKLGTGNAAPTGSKWIQWLAAKLRTAKAPEEIATVSAALEKAGVPKSVINEVLAADLQAIKKPFLTTPSPEAEAYYHGSSSGVPGSNAGMLQLSKDPEIAKMYAGRSGKSFRVSERKNTKLVDLSDHNEILKIAKDLENDYNSGKLYDLAQEMEHSIGKDALSTEDFQKIAKGFNPDEIVNSAENWDNSNLVDWFTRKYPHEMIKTRNGGIVLDPSKVNLEELR